MNYNRLSQKQRITARQNALEAVVSLAGGKPSRDAFRNTSYSKYPNWITSLVVGLAVIVLATSFILSAMRLYHLGSSTFRLSIDHHFSSVVAGAAIVLLSEAASVLFTIALSVIGQSRTQRYILLGSVTGTAGLALSGNYYVALAHHTITLFTALEAMLPPMLVLATAFVLKELLLHAIENRHADNIAYDQALSEWHAATANPEQHESYPQLYANELWDQLIRANRKTETREWLRSQDKNMKSRLVAREMQQDEWFDEPLDTTNNADEDTAEITPIYQEEQNSQRPLAMNGDGNA